ncbi:retrovirus-related pol polyprotein from transposon TNT 1-94 [Tanacetum coccineum]
MGISLLGLSSRTPGLAPVPSLEVVEMTVDLSRTLSLLPVPSYEPLVLGYLAISKAASGSSELMLSSVDSVTFFLTTGSKFSVINTMADMIIPANDVPAEQAPAIAPPTRMDDQILPSSKWVPIGKTSSMISTIYIQQFWDTICFNSSTGLYSCQLDEKWFNLYKDILRDALDITPLNDNNPFVAPPSSDVVIEYVNTLGHPRKTAGYDRPRHLVLQILWGITHCSNIDYAERIWEEFVQSIQTFLTDRKNLATTSRGKKKTAHLLILNVKFTKLIIHHLKNKHNIHPRPGSALHYSHEENILNILRYVGKDGREIFDDKSPEPASSQPPKLTPTPTESSKKDQGKKRKLVMESTDAPSPAKRSKVGKVTKKRMPKSSLQLVDEVVDEGVPEKEPAHDDEEANLQRALELSIKEQGERTQGPARPVVIREPDSGRIQPLPETPKPKNPTYQFIFQRCTPMPIEPSEHADSPSLDAELALTDSETESEEEVPVIKAGDQDEDQAGPNPSKQDEGQAGSNPGDAAKSQPQPSHVVYARPNLEHMDLETTNASTQQKPEQMDEEFTTTAYLNFQENLKLLTEDQVILEEPASSTGTLSSLQNLDKDLSFTDQFFVDKPREEEPGKTNAEAEVQSMVSVPIHQDTSSIPPMTTPVSKAVDEIVTDAVDWAMQAPLRARFRDLPTVDMKEILQQRIHDSSSHGKDVITHMRILSVVRIKAYSRYGYDYLSEIVLRRADFQEHMIVEKDFKNLYPSDFEDLNLLLLQGHLDHLPGSDKQMLSTVVKLWTQNLVIRQRVEDF